MHFISRLLNKGVKKSRMRSGTGIKKTNLRTYTRRLKSIVNKKHQSVNLELRNNKAGKLVGKSLTGENNGKR